MTDLEQTWRKAEAKAQQIMADKDKAIQAVKDEYGPDLQQANLEAAEAQKAYLDAEALRGLDDHPDKDALIQALGLAPPE